MANPVCCASCISFYVFLKLSRDARPVGRRARVEGEQDTLDVVVEWKSILVTIVMMFTDSS